MPDLEGETLEQRPLRGPAHRTSTRSVPIALKPDGVEVGDAHSFFRFNNSLGTVGIVSPYDASSDGQRFVLITTLEQTPRPPTLVTNWTAEL